MARTYSDADKALARGVVARYGELSKEAVGEIRRLLDAPDLNKSTIYRWVQAVATVQSEKKAGGADATVEAAEGQLQSLDEWAAVTLDNFFEATARTYLKHANEPKVVADLKGDRAVIAAATAVDKMRLLRDLPTEIVGILPGLLDVINRLGLSPYAVLTDLRVELENAVVN